MPPRVLCKGPDSQGQWQLPIALWLLASLWLLDKSQSQSLSLNLTKASQHSTKGGLLKYRTISQHHSLCGGRTSREEPRSRLAGTIGFWCRWPQTKDGTVFKPVSPPTLTGKGWDPGKCKRWSLTASSPNPQSSETMIYMNCVHHNSTQLTQKAHWHGIQLMFRKRIFESHFISAGLK